MRLIDEKQLLRSLVDWQMSNFVKVGHEREYNLLDSIIKGIENTHTVDAVEVVHCKDCKHWHKETAWCNKHSHFIDSNGDYCHTWESSCWKMFDENDFCSDGERRDNAVD